HPTGTEYGRDGVLGSFRFLMRARGPALRLEPLATLGDSLALFRQSVSTIANDSIEEFDFGATELEYIVVFEVNPQERVRWTEVFAADRLGDAVARLYERYANLLAAGPARDRAAATARSVAALLCSFDLARWATAIADDAAFVDHRLVGFGEMHGARAMLRAA